MAGWRRTELKVGVYDEIVSVRLDRQLAALGAPFEVYRAALTVSEPIGRGARIAARGPARPPAPIDGVLAAISTPAGSRCCAWSTFTTKASTFPTSIRCSSSAPPRVPRCSSNSSDAACVARPARPNWSCSTSPGDSTFSSDSIDGCDQHPAPSQVDAARHPIRKRTNGSRPFVGRMGRHATDSDTGTSRKRP
jgi:hypothetical protein